MLFQLSLLCSLGLQQPGDQDLAISLVIVLAHLAPRVSLGFLGKLLFWVCAVCVVGEYGHLFFGEAPNGEVMARGVGVWNYLYCRFWGCVLGLLGGGLTYWGFCHFRFLLLPSFSTIL